MATKTVLEKDWALIVGLGGPAKVAEKLGYEKEGGVQRVQNWKTRGIPSLVKLERPDLFLKKWDGNERRNGSADRRRSTK